MASDPDDALSWEGDDVAPAPAPARSTTPPPVDRPEPAAVPRGGGEADEADAEPDADAPPTGMSTAMLLFVGIMGGIYLLYSIGWVVGGLRLKPLANLIVADAMFVPWFVLAVLAPALWFVAGWVLTRARAAWLRVCVLLLGVVLLVPWPFVTVGVIGS